MKVPSRGPFMQCYTGEPFFPFDPRPEDVRLLDVAHHLAHKCRFNGASEVLYSVAEHCVRASAIVPSNHALATLLHDAPEAYGPDMIRPWKVGLKLLAMNAIDSIEKEIAKCVGLRFGVELVDLHPAVKLADNIMLATERRDVMTRTELDWGELPDPLDEVIVPWAPQEAKLRYIERFMQLTGGR